MLKALVIAAALALASNASAQLTLTVSSQGTEAMKLATGYTSKTATLVRLDACNEGAALSVSTTRLAAAVIAQEQYGIYGSDVVSDVLNVLQQKDVFSRAQKALGAAANTATLITALFKTLSPLTVSVLQAAPAIAQAVLPAVGDARDLAALSKQIMQDNATLALGAKGSGNDCHTGLAVAMSGAVNIDKITVQ
jgi:hypothetical protein